MHLPFGTTFEKGCILNLIIFQDFDFEKSNNLTNQKVAFWHNLFKGCKSKVYKGLPFGTTFLKVVY